MRYIISAEYVCKTLILIFNHLCVGVFVGVRVFHFRPELGQRANYKLNGK